MTRWLKWAVTHLWEGSTGVLVGLMTINGEDDADEELLNSEETDAITSLELNGDDRGNWGVYLPNEDVKLVVLLLRLRSRGSSWCPPWLSSSVLKSSTVDDVGEEGTSGPLISEKASFSSLIKGSNEDEGLYERPLVSLFHRLDPSNSWATSSKPERRRDIE